MNAISMIIIILEFNLTELVNKNKIDPRKAIKVNSLSMAA